MKEANHFDSEHEFRQWFDKNLAHFGIRSIVLNQEVCPDYVVIMESGETKKVEAELLVINFRYLMRHFATESGKSKGQFYTPSEVMS